MKLKPFLFGLTAAALPFLLLLLVEGALRMAGVAADSRRVFQPVPGRPDYVALSPAYVQRYFPAFAPAVAFNPFLKEKDADAFRVFVLGGSSAAGFPYQFYYGFPARLEARLQAAAPSRRIEVVNLGMTAVNSYTLWDLKDAVAAQRPDAVVIYAGHNEYYGAFGAGSAIYALGNRVWLKRLILRLKRVVLYTLLERLLVGTPEQRLEGQAPEGRTMMARVVRDATIALDSPVYAAGVAQYEANMRDVLQTFQEAGIPVYLGTLAANLKDQPPLGDHPEALAAYRRGRAFLADGDTLAARTAFLEAKERDDIRFRAPEALNDRLRAFAEGPQVKLVDVQAFLRTRSPLHLEDEALFCDHLHPNDRGYDLMAMAFFEALKDHPALDGAPAMDVQADSFSIDPFEKAHAAIQIGRLKAGYPFDKTATPEEEDRAYRELLNRYRGSGRYPDSLAVVALTTPTPVQEVLYEGVRLARSRSDTLTALLLYRALLYWQPFNAALMDDAVRYALDHPAYDPVVGDIARYAVNRTRAAYPLNALAVIALRQGRLAEASVLLAEAEAQDSTSQAMLYNKARLLILQGDTLAARRYFERYQTQLRSGRRGAGESTGRR